jgi:Rod binding domain-containing protein
VNGLDLSSVAGATAIPADVRAAGKSAQETYRSALAFERVLVGELTKTMSAGTTGETGGQDGEDGDGEGQTAATSAYRDMLPGIMADTVTNAGGMGLARNIYESMRRPA